MGDAKLGFFASALHFHPHARLIPIRELDEEQSNNGACAKLINIKSPFVPHPSTP
jgi:hypothetical protein